MAAAFIVNLKCARWRTAARKGKWLFGTTVFLAAALELASLVIHMKGAIIRHARFEQGAYT